MKYPRQLSSGANNVVVALSETEVAKLFIEDTRSEIGSEAEKMKFANTVNDLIGLRLIDVGISALRAQVGAKLFSKYIETDCRRWKSLRNSS